MVALAQFGLMTGFPALPDRRQENIAWSSPQEWIFLTVCVFRTTDRLCCVVLCCLVLSGISMNEELTSVLALAQLELTTGFPALSS